MALALVLFLSTRGLGPSWARLGLLGPVVALSDKCTGGWVLQALMLSCPGFLVQLRWRPSWRSWLGSCMVTVLTWALLQWYLTEPLVLALGALTLASTRLAACLAKEERLNQEARELGLEHSPGLPPLSVQAARVAGAVADGFSPLAWCLDLSAGLWRRLDGPGPVYD